jgi:hypothetical protein
VSARSKLLVQAGGHLGSLAFGGLSGILFADWCRLLRRHYRDVDAVYWPRALILGATSLVNSLVHAYEKRTHGRALAAIEVPPPLFVLGHYRSGTTHLHNLLALDEQLAFPNLYQVLFPHTFLTTERLGTALASSFLPETRLVDGMAFGLELPMEDEYALCVATLLSPFLGWTFPRYWDHYARYISFREAGADEVQRWKVGFISFLKKVTLKTGRPLVLKSPLHTCRIRLLLELFPAARFLHVHRHPYVVYQSTLHYERTLGNSHARLQRPRTDLAHEWILRRHKLMFEAFFAERELIPAGRFHELAFADLERAPAEQLAAAYERLGLAGFERVRPRIESYTAALAGYRKNRFTELPAARKEEIRREWGRCFDAWGYAG